MPVLTGLFFRQRGSTQITQMPVRPPAYLNVIPQQP